MGEGICVHYVYIEVGVCVHGMGICPEGNGVTSCLHSISTCQAAESEQRADSLWR